jgi:hypothetical protein
VCGWVDDALQLRFPLRAGGANRLSLFAGQRAFMGSGRPAVDRDPFWRPLDRRRDLGEHATDDPDVDISLTWPADAQELYYWTSNYWLRRDPQRYLYGRHCPLPRRGFSEAELGPALDTLKKTVTELSALSPGASLDAVNAVLLSERGKSLLAVASSDQADRFGIDPRQRTFLRALWYGLNELNDAIRSENGAGVESGWRLVTAVAASIHLEN